METLGILYICTGKYDVFWETFYESCEKYLIDVNKKYFVFTDSDQILNHNDKEKVVTVYQENLGWPENTLFRFEVFNRHKELYDTDYLYFFNANMLFVDYVGKEILPDGDEIVCVKHPGFHNKNNRQFAYCRDIRSKAFIPYLRGKVYVMGGVNGGRTASFLKMSEELGKRIRREYDKGIIAVWHDESHLNRYVYENGCKLLEPSYGFAEGWDLPFPEKIIIRNKDKWLDVDKIKNNVE